MICIMSQGKILATETHSPHAQLHQLRQYTFATPQRRESQRSSSTPCHRALQAFALCSSQNMRTDYAARIICCARSTCLSAKTCSASPRQRLVMAIYDLPTLLTTNESTGGARRGGVVGSAVSKASAIPLTKSQPPVMLMCRDTAGRCECRSMMKSCPLGLRVIADLIAALRTSSLSDWRNGERRSAASSWPRHM